MILINFTIIARLTFGTGLIGHYAPLEAAGPFLGILGIIVCVISFVNSFVYQRTKSIASTSFFSALILTLFQAGKLFGNYV